MIGEESADMLSNGDKMASKGDYSTDSYTCLLHACSLETYSSKGFITRKLSKQDRVVKLTSIDFSCQVTEGVRSSWLQALANQLISLSHTLGILTANITYCIILLEYVNKTQMNAHIHVHVHCTSSIENQPNLCTSH